MDYHFSIRFEGSEDPLVLKGGSLLTPTLSHYFEIKKASLTKGPFNPNLMLNCQDILNFIDGV